MRIVSTSIRVRKSQSMLFSRVRYMGWGQVQINPGLTFHLERFLGAGRPRYQVLQAAGLAVERIVLSRKGN